MSVHKKLMEARIELQGTALKKSGLNKFAGYSYFELGDFLPVVQSIFNRLGLCGVVSYSIEYATLTITDTEDSTVIVITSPMAEANLKGTHPIQNLGAVETYSRRYLWMTAMEIVEHDILDASTGYEPPPKPAAKPAPAPTKANPPAAAPKPAAAPAKSVTNAAGEKVTAGKPGEWQITLYEREDGDWATVILDATDMALQLAQSSEDVQNIFKANRVHYDRLKEETPTIYEDLLAKLKKAKASFTQD
jgi:hypothetical protein